MAKKAVCLLLFVLFLHAVMLDGLAPSTARTAPGPGGKAVLITFDVCGHHAPAGAVSHFDLTVDIHECPALLLHPLKEFPPRPDEAAPSAEPGEIEHPPEA